MNEYANEEFSPTAKTVIEDNNYALSIKDKVITSENIESPDPMTAAEQYGPSPTLRVRSRSRSRSISPSSSGRRERCRLGNEVTFNNSVDSLKGSEDDISLKPNANSTEGNFITLQEESCESRNTIDEKSVLSKEKTIHAISSVEEQISVEENNTRGLIPLEMQGRGSTSVLDKTDGLVTAPKSVGRYPIIHTVETSSNPRSGLLPSPEYFPFGRGRGRPIPAWKKDFGYSRSPIIEKSYDYAPRTILPVSPARAKFYIGPGPSRIISPGRHRIITNSSMRTHAGIRVLSPNGPYSILPKNSSLVDSPYSHSGGHHSVQDSPRIIGSYRSSPRRGGFNRSPSDGQKLPSLRYGYGYRPYYSSGDNRPSILSPNRPSSAVRNEFASSSPPGLLGQPPASVSHSVSPNMSFPTNDASKMSSSGPVMSGGASIMSGSGPIRSTAGSAMPTVDSSTSFSGTLAYPNYSLRPSHALPAQKMNDSAINPQSFVPMSKGFDDPVERRHATMLNSVENRNLNMEPPTMLTNNMGEGAPGSKAASVALAQQIARQISEETMTTPNMVIRPSSQVSLNPAAVSLPVVGMHHALVQNSNVSPSSLLMMGQPTHDTSNLTQGMAMRSAAPVIIPPMSAVPPTQSVTRAAPTSYIGGARSSAVNSAAATAPTAPFSNTMPSQSSTGVGWFAQYADTSYDLSMSIGTSTSSVAQAQSVTGLPAAEFSSSSVSYVNPASTDLTAQTQSWTQSFSQLDLQQQLMYQQYYQQWYLQALQQQQQQQQHQQQLQQHQQQLQQHQQQMQQHPQQMQQHPQQMQQHPQQMQQHPQQMQQHPQQLQQHPQQLQQHPQQQQQIASTPDTQQMIQLQMQAYQQAMQQKSSLPMLQIPTQGTLDPTSFR